MNKLHNIRYGFMKFSWTFQQWQALMFPHIPCEGETKIIVKVLKDIFDKDKND